MIEEELPERLHQSGAEMRFPAIFGYVPWRHHVEIITKCNSVEEVPLFENDAYREAVINAFLHNRWIDGGEPVYKYCLFPEDELLKMAWAETLK